MTIPAHSVILSLASDVFKAQFFGVKQEKRVRITDAFPDYFREFLR